MNKNVLANIKEAKVKQVTLTVTDMDKIIIS